jgi:hypothetical protein
MYLFATGGLIALMLIGTKFNHRQAQIERELSARQRHGYILAGEQGPAEPPVAGSQAIQLRPLFVLLSLLIVGAWTAFWIQRVRQTDRADERPQAVDSLREA